MAEYRGYRIEPMGTFSMVKIKSKGSGDVPTPLRGHYTSHKEAQIAIDRNLEKVMRRGRKANGKEASTSTN